MFRFLRIGLRDEGILFTSSNPTLGTVPRGALWGSLSHQGEREQLVAFHGFRAKGESKLAPMGPIPTKLRAQGDSCGTIGEQVLVASH